MKPAAPIQINATLLKRITKAVLVVGEPLKIVIFGSYARNEADSQSDLDLLIIEESDQPRFKRSPRYYLALKDIVIPKDIAVWTPAEVHDWSEVPNAFVTAALREGKIIYEKKQ